MINNYDSGTQTLNLPGIRLSLGEAENESEGGDEGGHEEHDDD